MQRSLNKNAFKGQDIFKTTNLGTLLLIFITHAYKFVAILPSPVI